MTDYKNLKRFEKSQINGLTKYLSKLRFGSGWTAVERQQRYDLTIDKALELGMEIDYNNSHIAGEKFIFLKPRKITAEQTKLGKSWLKDYFFKLDGSARSGKRTQYIGDRVLRIAKSVSRFEFVGVLGCAPSYGTFVQFLPVYRAFDRNGNYFDYSPVHWGEPVIME